MAHCIVSAAYGTPQMTRTLSMRCHLPCCARYNAHRHAMRCQCLFACTVLWDNKRMPSWVKHQMCIWRAECDNIRQHNIQFTPCRPLSRLLFFCSSYPNVLRYHRIPFLCKLDFYVRFCFVSWNCNSILCRIASFRWFLVSFIPYVWIGNSRPISVWQSRIRIKSHNSGIYARQCFVDQKSFNHKSVRTRSLFTRGKRSSED